jgi:hypothetical protein
MATAVAKRTVAGVTSVQLHLQGDTTFPFLQTHGHSGGGPARYRGSVGLDSCFAHSSTLKMEAICSSETSPDGLQVINSQKIELFIITVVRTSDPTDD